MKISNLVYVLIFVTVCFLVYKLFKWIRDKRNARPLWNPEDENILKDALNRIYASTNFEDLNNTFAKEIRFNPKYHDLFKVAYEDRHRELAKNAPDLSFEIKEGKARRRWLLSFFANYSLYWLSSALALIFFNSYEDSLYHMIALFIAFGVFVGFIMWVIYYCAYKKKGTAILSWIVFFSPLQILNSFRKEGIDMSMWYVTAFYIVAFGIYWIYSFRLRRINYEVKARKQLIQLKALM